MKSQIEICPNCFFAPYRGGRCPKCGYTATEQTENSIALSPGTVLNERYLVGRLLGLGGFGVTYLALDTTTQTKIAIKEYFPSSLAVREADRTICFNGKGDSRIYDHGMKAFIREAKSLSKFIGQKNIVQVSHSFFENGTGYFVMEYLNGVNLKVLRKGMGGKIPFSLAYEILLTLVGTLEYIHKEGLLHRDISPENIFMTGSGEVKIIDFGATRYYIGEESRSLAIVLKPGFAPPEQYSSKGEQGPWTDVYALATTFYQSVSDIRVPEAPDRLAGKSIEPLFNLVPEVNEKLSAVIEKAMALDHKKRFQSMEEFQNAILKCGQSGEERVVSKLEAAGTPYISVDSGSLKGEKWAIPSGADIRIGRQPSANHIVISDVQVSREHCVIRYDQKNGIFFLKDISTNGTFSERGDRFDKGEDVVLAPGASFCLAKDRLLIRLGLE